MSVTSTLDQPALDLHEISVERDARLLIDNVSLRVERDQRWLVLGANGSGKTTLVRIAAMYDHPTRGVVSVMGETLGSTDVRQLRRRIGYVSASFASDLRPALIARDVVMTAKHAALEPWWHPYDDGDRRRALECLERMRVGTMADRTFGSMSSGEQQRVLLARSLMNDPDVVLLDEPSARLDLGGREQLVTALSDIVDDRTAPALVLVTHHLDEVPPGMTHALLLRDGRALASGIFDHVVTAENLSECFGVKLRVDRRPNGRLTAYVD